MYPSAEPMGIAAKKTANPIGSALGYIVGGLVDHYFGWRQAFFVAGGPGVGVGFLALRPYDPPRGSQEAGPPPPSPLPKLEGGGGGGGTPAAHHTLTSKPPYLLT